MRGRVLCYRTHFVKGNLKFVPVHTWRVGVVEVLATPFLNLVPRWRFVVGFMPRDIGLRSILYIVEKRQESVASARIGTTIYPSLSP